MQQLGHVVANSTIRICFNTNETNSDAATFTGDVSNVRIYKDGSTTQRTSTAGCTLSKDFDSIVGTHILTIDLSDNTDAGFYAEEHSYVVMLCEIVINSESTSMILGQFDIDNQPLIL